jgi:alanine dehydrogenase
MAVLVLKEADIDQLVTMEEAIPIVESAFRKISLDEAVGLPRQRCQTDHVMLHTQSSAAKTLNALGVKATATGHFPDESRIFFFDSKKGNLSAILDCETITQIRTCAGSAVAVKKLSRPDAKILAILGTGKAAQLQIEAVSKVRKLTTIKLFTHEKESAQALLPSFAQDIQAKTGCVVQICNSAEEAVRQSDIVVTTTNSREPILFGDWLTEGCHINLIGSSFVSQVEADVSVFRKANVISIDNKEQGKTEAGDFMASLRENVFSWSDVFEIPHIITGRYPGRESPKDITVFKELGLGLLDLAIAAKVIEKAKAKGVGREIEI